MRDGAGSDDDRVRRSESRPRFGSQWFGITGDLAEYLVDRAAEIEETYRMSLCCDEILLQTMAAGSPVAPAVFESRVTGPHTGALRRIDWSRGDPYTFRSSDYQELIDSPQLFARKFDMDVDAEIVQRVSAFVAGGAVRDTDDGVPLPEGGATSRSGGSPR